MTTRRPEHLAPLQTDADYLLGALDEELRQVGFEPYTVPQEGLALELRDMPSLYAADQDLIGVLDVAGRAVKMYALGDIGVILAAPDFYLHQSRGRHARRESQTNYVVVGVGGGPRSFGRGEAGAELLGLDAQQVSRHHFSVEVADGKVVLRDEGSMHGTRFVASSASEYADNQIATDPSHMAIHTQYTANMARLVGKLDETGSFGGRRLIGRDTVIGGPHPEATVDIRAWSAGGEAIVLEEDDDPTGEYGKLRNGALHRIEVMQANLGRPLIESEILQAINETVAATMAYDASFVDALSEKLAAAGEEWRLVNLDYYLQAGKGICRHMALAAAWLGGEFTAQGMLSGRLTADVNQRVETPDAHEWARYTSQTGEVYILDPTGPYFGRLGDPNAPWNYYRPEEQWMAKRKVAAGLAAAVVGP